MYRNILLGLILWSLSNPAAWAVGPIVGDDAVASWTNPTTTVSGAPLTDLAGITVWIGTQSQDYSIKYNAGLVSSIPVSNLKLVDGQYYMALQAYDTNGFVSGLGNEVAFCLQACNTTTTTTPTTTTTIRPKPDLIITQEEPNVPSVNAGAMLSVADSVTNQGTANANSFRIYYHLSGDAVYGNADDKILLPLRAVSGLLGPGASNASAGFSLKIPLTIVPGTYYVCAEIFAVIPPESNPNNNTFCSTTTVTVPLPDLVISALTTTSTSAKVGSIIRVSLSVTNQGGSRLKLLSKVELHASTNSIYGDGDDNSSPYRATTSLLAPGQTRTLGSWPVKMPPTPGTYYVCARADADDVVTETDETNNTLCTTTTITLHP